MSAASSTHSGPSPLSLMSCVRESSPPQDGMEYEGDKTGELQDVYKFSYRILKIFHYICPWEGTIFMQLG